MPDKLPDDFLKRLQAVTGMRPKRVIDHILKHGHITTQELKDQYGYNHPPRAARDVRELGIPLETFKVTGSDGRKIAAYRFADPSQARGSTHGGRTNFPKVFKKELIALHGYKCAVCSGTFPAIFLQIDHRVPYEVGGQTAGTPKPKDYMLVCRTCNRGKSWSCEHCKNWTDYKKPKVCLSCFWANPTTYQHIALQPIRRLNVTWTEEEVAEYDRLADLSKNADTDMPEYVKLILRRHLDE